MKRRWYERGSKQSWLIGTTGYGITAALWLLAINRNIKL
jgi:hypothetical protein